MIKWKAETRKLSDLKGWDNNPRKITPERREELKNSLEQRGNFEPLVINIDGTVIAGNQRLSTLAELGVEEVEVVVPERELTEKEVKEIGLISNRHVGDWDKELLKEFTIELQDLGYDDLLPAPMFESSSEDAPEGDVDVDYPDEKDNGIKMVTFLMKASVHTKFQENIEKLKDQYDTDNLTDTVVQAVQECVDYIDENNKS